MLAISTPDPVVAGLLFLVAAIVFVIAAWVARAELWACLVAVGLAVCASVWAWDRLAFA